jgi:hypothetical protein
MDFQSKALRQLKRMACCGNRDRCCCAVEIKAGWVAIWQLQARRNEQPRSAGSDGVVRFEDTNAPTYPTPFYRSVSP